MFLTRGVAYSQLCFRKTNLVETGAQLQGSSTSPGRSQEQQGERDGTADGLWEAQHTKRSQK